MSCGFSKTNPVGQPTWTKVTANDGVFVPLSVVPTGEPEVGYGEGGYGEGGYDAPGAPGVLAGTPDWVPLLDIDDRSTYHAFVITDSNDAPWIITIQPTGNLVSTQQFPDGGTVFYPDTLILRDSSGLYWLVSISTTGDLTTTLTTFTEDRSIHYADEIELEDSDCNSWSVTVQITGNLVTTRE